MIGGTVPPVSRSPSWICNEDWVTVRSDGTEENEENSSELDVLLADEIPLLAESFMGPSVQLEEFGSSIFDEDSLSHTVESISTISTSSIRDDDVFLISNCENDNKKLCLHPSQFFDLNSKSTEYHLILFVQVILDSRCFICSYLAGDAKLALQRLISLLCVKRTTFFSLSFL